ncbi:sugar O-acetyltransferase [Shewanella electrica]|uniref:sugar O-acetyltransferase n=1 Tax=Shewanella electrica TaxID=515560 RepID=UPI0023AF2F00|nr:sugar O-acetyltransferase [Shewanella electrica]
MERAFDAMVAGRPYCINDAELVEIRYQTRDRVDEFNALSARQVAQKTQLIKQIFAAVGDDVHIEKPLRVDYGCTTKLGSHVFINFNLTVLDPGEITIGNHVFIGPNVCLYTALHPLDIAERDRHIGTTLPIKIGNHVWIAGDVKILPGVSIGDGAVVGAGSVVTKDVPAGMLAVGNPARVIRKAEPTDK